MVIWLIFHNYRVGLNQYQIWGIVIDYQLELCWNKLRQRKFRVERENKSLRWEINKQKGQKNIGKVHRRKLKNEEWYSQKIWG